MRLPESRQTTKNRCFCHFRSGYSLGFCDIDRIWKESALWYMVFCGLRRKLGVRHTSRFLLHVGV